MSPVYNNALYRSGVRALTGTPLLRHSSRLHQGRSFPHTSREWLQTCGIRTYQSRETTSISAPRSVGVVKGRKDKSQQYESANIDDNSLKWWDELRSQSSLSQSFRPSALGSNGAKAFNDIADDADDAGDAGDADGAGNADGSGDADDTDDTDDDRVTMWAGRYYQHKRAFLEETPTESLVSAIQRTYHGLDYTVPVRRGLSGYKSNVVLKAPSKISLQTILANYISEVDRLLYRRGPVKEYDLKIDEALGHVFDDTHLQFLAAKGYYAEDVMSWAWILKAQRSSRAAMRFLALAKYYNSQTKRIPMFIPILLLRRKHLDSTAFRILLLYSLHAMNQKPNSTIASTVGSVPGDLQHIARLFEKQSPRVAAPTAMTIVMRLLYHSRYLWPAAQISIASSFASFLTHSLTEKNGSAWAITGLHRIRARFFNAALWMLSIPSKKSPFMSAFIRQRAQFELLRAMGAHRPVLPVSRRGYQALVSVQISHKKTVAEAQSASYKAASWPPWKEDKLGIDSQRGTEGMKSRAMQILSQMQEAGYPHRVWEEVAAILAGWDTDGSPTIQTRRLTPLPGSLSALAKSRPNDPAIWKARIRATRTVREAWACFLSHQDLNLLPNMGIYYAMAEKLVYHREAIARGFDHISHTLPGDGLEVFPEPSSARDVIYVRTEPPSLDDLLKKMLSQGIRPSGRFLAFLLSTCTNFRSGLEYLSCSNLSAEQVKALCKLYPYRIPDDTAHIINTMPDYLLLAFVKFLCKYSNFDALYANGYELRMTDLFPVIMGNLHDTAPTSITLFSYSCVLGGDDLVHHPRALAHAVQLIRRLKPANTPIWISLLKALATPRIRYMDQGMRRDVQHFLNWHEIIKVLEWMRQIDVELGMEGFTILTRAFSHAVTAGIRDPIAAEDGLRIVKEALQRNKESFQSIPHLISSIPQTFEETVHEGLRVIKNLFDRLVLPVAEPPADVNDEDEVATDGHVTDFKPLLPPMMQVPTPAALHEFIRALGLAEDYDGLLNLLRWMSRSAPILRETAMELANGERMMRRALIAVRVFLEGYWEHEMSLRKPTSGKDALNAPKTPGTDSTYRESTIVQEPSPAFPNAYVEEAYRIIENTAAWGSWPTDEEVQQYLFGYSLEEE